MTCAVPHPFRARDDEFVADLEIIGGHSTENWLRCRRCGAWFWATTNLGDNKYNYVGHVELDPADAARAFLAHDVDAVARVVVTANVPVSLSWGTATTLAWIFRALTPGATDAVRARALLAVPARATWGAAAQLLAQDARAAAQAPPQELVFAIDLKLPGHELGEYFEVGNSLVLFSAGRAELLRLDANGLVQQPLSGVPRWAASRRDEQTKRCDALALAIPTPGGDAVLILDATGAATASPPTPTPFAVTALDDDWWLFVPLVSGPDRAIQLHRPDGTPHVKLPRRFAGDGHWMPPPRRFADGWIVSNLIDDDGHLQALTLFDAQFRTAAFSTGITGERVVTPIDESTFWASAKGPSGNANDATIERWVRRGKALEREQSYPARSTWFVGDRLVIEAPRGTITARDPAGQVVWTWHRTMTGASYGAVTIAGILFYDDTRADLLDRDGREVTTFAVENPHVYEGEGRTVYLKTGAELWIIREHAWSLEIGSDLELETTCGDDALLRRDDGSCLLVSRDGSRLGFEALHASFSVFGTTGGPYVVEGDRIRVRRFT